MRTPVVVYVASLYPVITLVVMGALGVGLVLYLGWRGWIEKRRRTRTGTTPKGLRISAASGLLLVAFV